MGDMASKTVNFDTPDHGHSEPPTHEGVAELVEKDGDEHHRAEGDRVPDRLRALEAHQQEEAADVQETRLYIDGEAEDLKTRQRPSQLRWPSASR